MKYNVKNDKLNSEVTVEANSVGHAMSLARKLHSKLPKESQWANYGTRRYTGNYRNYTIKRGIK